MYLRLVFLFIVKCTCFSHNKYDKLKQHAISNGAVISNLINIYSSSSSSSAHYVSTSHIPSNTTILSIPYSLFINTNTTLPFLTKLQKRLYTSLSSFYLNNTSSTTSLTSLPSNSITNLPLRVNEIFLSYLQSTCIPNHHKKKPNKLFKHFKHFFNLHSQSEVDSFPIHYTTEQMQLLVNTSLGSQIELTKQSLEDEAITIKELLSTNTSSAASTLFNYEEYYKYRVLTIAKGVYLNDDIHLIPFIDLFMTHPVDYNLQYEYDNETQMLNVITVKDIMKGENAVLQGYNVSNLFSLLFYGKTFGKEGDYLDKYMIPVVHKLWVIERENADDDDEYDEEGGDVFYDMVDLGKDDWYVEALGKYKTLCKVIGKAVNDLNAYKLMYENFNMFMYDYTYVKDYMYDKEFFTKTDALNVKRVINTEKALLHNRIAHVERMIKELSKHKYNNNNNVGVNEDDL